MNVLKNNFDRFGRHLSVFEGLEENEQLWMFGNRMTKSISPYCVLENAKNPVLKAIHKITSFALRLIFRLGRILTRQNEKRCLSKVERLADNIMKGLGKGMSETVTNDHYEILEKIGVISRLLQTLEPGFANVKKTYKDELFAQKLDSLHDKLNAMAPIVDKRAEQIENMMREKDVKKVRDIFGYIKTKEKNKKDLSNIFVTLDAFKTTVVEKYGENLFSTALELYDLENRKTLNGDEVAALLVGIVTHITLQDLKEIYQLSKKQGTKEFDDLTEEQLCDLLDTVRDIDYNAVPVNQRMRYTNQLLQDQYLLSHMADYKDFQCREVEGLRVNALKKYSYAEFLGKHIPYGLFSYSNTKFADGILFPIHEEENRKSLKQAEKIIAKKGVYAAVVTPAIASSKEDAIQVIFRGTACADSIYRDLNPWERVATYLFDGPGRASFEAASDHLIQKVLAKAADLGEDTKYTLELFGHSLGACDAQRFIAALTHKLKEESDPPFSGMRLFAFNSPNVEPDIARGFVDDVKHLFMKNGVDLLYFNFDHDGIQETGVMRLGYCRSNQKRPENMRTTVIKFNLSFADRLAEFGKTIFKRIKLLCKEYVNAHVAYALKEHVFSDLTRRNKTYIEYIMTDNPKDIRLVYGKNMEKISKKAKHEELNDVLLTHTARFGRKLKRIQRKVAGIFCWTKPQREPQLQPG